MSFIETHEVVGMTCDHCVRAVRAEVSAIEGVTDVDVDLVRGVVRVTAKQPVPPRLSATRSRRPATRWPDPSPHAPVG